MTLRVNNIPVKFRKARDYDAETWRCYDVFLAYIVGSGSESLGQVVAYGGKWLVVGSDGYDYGSRRAAAVKVVMRRRS